MSLAQRLHPRRALGLLIPALALALLLLALWVTRRIERSRTGYYFRAIREDQDAAASLGIPVARYKQRAMAISAALATRP